MTTDEHRGTFDACEQEDDHRGGGPRRCRAPGAAGTGGRRREPTAPGHGRFGRDARRVRRRRDRRAGRRGLRGRVQPDDRSAFDGSRHGEHRRHGVVERRLHRQGDRRRGDRLRRVTGRRSERDQQDRLRPRPLVGVPDAEPAQPRHVRPRNVHGRLDRRSRRGVDRPLRPGTGQRLSRHGSRRPDRVAEGRHRRRRRRRLTGDRRDQLGRAAQGRPGHEDPRPEPLVRHQLDPGIHHRSTVLRRRAGMEERHRRRRRRWEQRLPHGRSRRSGLQPLHHLGRSLRLDGHGHG